MLNSIPPNMRSNIEQRVKNKYLIDIETGCYRWVGAVDGSGVPKIYFNGGTSGARRILWILNKEDLSDEVTLDPICGNKECVNPAHMEIHERGVYRGKVSLYKKFPDYDERIKSLYESGVSTKDIGREFGVSSVSVCNRLHVLGVTLREGWKFLSPEERAERKSRREQANKIMSKFSRIKHVYGMSKEEYEEFIVKKGGSCQICGSKNNLCIDHEHDTQVIRGLLCSKCNSAIGFLGDDAELCLKAGEYLNKTRSNRGNEVG